MSENVVPLTRPPIRQSIIVPSDREHTFDVFTQRLAEWWPLVPFSAGGARVRSVTLDARAGGQVVEIWDDGTEVAWGELLTWEPPERFCMTWNVTVTPTEVEIGFAAVSPGVTRVDLEHRGWDRLSEQELATDCGVPGGYYGGAFNEGWRQILTAFKEALEA